MFESIYDVPMDLHTTTVTYSGWCPHCSKEHHIRAGDAEEAARALMNELESTRRVDTTVPVEQRDPRFSTDYLFGPARGHMFGVLTGLDSHGNRHVLRAFSGQYNGVWLIDGWTPPLFNVEQFDAIMLPGDKQIKELGLRIRDLSPDAPERKRLVQERRHLSRRLMIALHDLYVLNNFRGQTAALTDFFPSHKGIPTGAGDCCAPKLLNQAAQQNLRPTGLVEFYWGKENASGTRIHGHPYSNCPDKCGPILGFMLCGVNA